MKSAFFMAAVPAFMASAVLALVATPGTALASSRAFSLSASSAPTAPVAVLFARNPTLQITHPGMSESNGIALANLGAHQLEARSDRRSQARSKGKAPSRAPPTLARAQSTLARAPPTRARTPSTLARTPPSETSKTRSRRPAPQAKRSRKARQFHSTSGNSDIPNDYAGRLLTGKELEDFNWTDLYGRDHRTVPGDGTYEDANGTLRRNRDGVAIEYHKWTLLHGPINPGPMG